MAIIKHYILVGNKRYDYTLEPARSHTTIVCRGANLNQRFSNDQIPAVLTQLAREIMLARSEAAAQSEVMRFRVTPDEKQMIEQRALDAGFDNVSAYLRYVALGEGDGN